MNIIIVTSSVTRTASGLFDAVKDLFVNNAFAGQQLRVLSYENSYVKEDLPKWKNVPVSLFKPHAFLYSRGLKKTLLESRADIFHQEGLWRYPHLLMAKWARRTGHPIVCSPHGMLNQRIIKAQGRLKRIVSNLFFQKSLEAVTCYHALCQAELENIRAYGMTQPIAVIPNGVYLPTNEQRFQKANDKKHLLYLGRLNEIKGIDTTLRAFGQLKRENAALSATWHFDIVGGGSDAYTNYLRDIVADEGLTDCVTFHGPLFGEEKERAYATCDAFVMASHYEALPMTVLEAWAWRKPVVITPYCHFPEGYKQGAAIEIDDNEASIKEGLAQLIGLSDAARTEMGECGRRLVEQNYTWDVSAQKMIALYEWLSGGGERPEFVYLLTPVNGGVESASS